MHPNLLAVSPFRETAGMCGPASLKMVLGYYGIEISEARLAKLCKTTRLGTSAEGIKRAAVRLGCKVEIKDHSSFSDIRRWLDKRVPVIVDWFTRGRADYDDADIADGHYSVVVGLDKEFIHLQDPELGHARRIKREDFMVVWFDFKGKHITPDTLVIRQIIAVYK